MANLPTDKQARKERPIARGVLDYFPDALSEVAHCSFVANEQHNPGEPVHWAKENSTDEADALIRHLIDRGTFDDDGIRHSAKVAWRALALLQREIDAEQEALQEASRKFNDAMEHASDVTGLEVVAVILDKPASIDDADWEAHARGRYRRTDKMEDHEHFDEPKGEPV